MLSYNMAMGGTLLVRPGYDAAFAAYMAERGQLRSAPYVRKFLKMLRANSSVLDLGCGAGVPVDDLILKDGHFLTGIDISPVMIAAARKNCPGGNYAVGDMRTLVSGEYSVDGVVSLYALFHIPRSDHGRVLKVIRSYLPKQGLLLISLGDIDFEGTTQFYGQSMWWSQWGQEKNRKLVEAAGFDISLDEIDHSGAEHHQFILARAR